ncbi:MAG: hypothetical protein KF741_08735 [Ferruginibacter sp.]|nr:hypothetical protein [Bacteroidota bacterium]MBX2919314.1 hypothetical protein [Ferruginibacter sp.]
MLFNLFGKKDAGDDTHVFTDRAYISTAAKMNACAALAKNDDNYIFICWFADTASALKNFFKQLALDENLVIETHHLHGSKLQGKTPVFAEHYPLHEKEIELVKNWGPEKIIVMSALDEPIFKYFGSDKILPLLKMMGMKEDEPIEHSMVSKSIINGQKKISQMIVTEHLADSQSKWMQKNLKG